MYPYWYSCPTKNQQFPVTLNISHDSINMYIHLDEKLNRPFELVIRVMLKILL